MKTEVKCITINTDASFHHAVKVGGYAFYIICDNFKIQKAGQFRNNPESPLEAEIMAIGNALQMLLNQNNIPKSNWLIINTDCMNAIRDIKKQRSELAKKVFKIWQKVIIKTESKRNEFRHVKAHNGTPDARSYVNDWCDREAKKWMRKQVKEINLSNIND
jgi:ribonuclease HI